MKMCEDNDEETRQFSFQWIKMRICHLKWLYLKTSEKIIVDEEKIHWQLLQLPTKRKREVFALLLVFRFRLSSNWLFVFIVQSTGIASLFYLFTVVIFNSIGESLVKKSSDCLSRRKIWYSLFSSNLCSVLQGDQSVEWRCVCRHASIETNENTDGFLVNFVHLFDGEIFVCQRVTFTWSNFPFIFSPTYGWWRKQKTRSLLRRVSKRERCRRFLCW